MTSPNGHGSMTADFTPTVPASLPLASLSSASHQPRIGPSSGTGPAFQRASRPKVIIITGGDSKVMPMLKGLIRSLEAFPERDQVEIGCLDVGQSNEERAWLASRGVILAVPTSHLGVPDERLKPYERAFLARPFLRDYFPGRDIYLWIDSDVWLQGWWVIDGFCRGALETGMAIAHERERAYAFQGRLYGWFGKHMVLGYGLIDGAWLLSRPHLNAGLFAMSSDSSHWNLWERAYQVAWERTGKISPHDQFSINRVIYGSVTEQPKAKTTLLPPRYNWICCRGQPMWNDTTQTLCEPYAPYRTIGAVHLAGPGKTTRYAIRRTGGGRFEALLQQGVQPPA